MAVSQDLWDLAYQRLLSQEPRIASKYQVILAADSSTCGLQLSETIDQTSPQQLKNRQTQLKFYVEKKLEEIDKSSSKLVRTWDKAARIVQLAQSFVGSIVAADPHAALAWAGICILLPLLLNPVQQRQANLDGLAYISELVDRSVVRERLYRQNDGKSPRDRLPGIARLRYDFEIASLDLYHKILEFQSRAVIHFNRIKIHRGFRNFLKSDQWDENLRQIKELESRCTRASDVLDSQAIHSTAATQESSDYRKILEGLRSCDYSARKNINPPRAPGTCEWVTEHSNFKTWLSDEEKTNLLWITAPPGCGKSVLSRYLIDTYLMQQLRSAKIVYYFFKDDDAEAKSAVHALRSLLHQIYSWNSELLTHIRSSFDQNREKLFALFHELWNVFTDTVCDPAAGNLVFVLDALDECETTERSTLISKLSDLLGGDARTYGVKFLLTGRPSHAMSVNFAERYESIKIIRLMGESPSELGAIAGEVGIFIEEKIAQFGSLRRSHGLHDDAMQQIRERLSMIQNRTYLWASLVFKDLFRNSAMSIRTLAEVIANVSEDTFQAYEKILQRCQDPVRARKLLHIVVAAFRPLTPLELNYAMAIREVDTDEKSIDLFPPETFATVIREICRDFIHVFDGHVHLIHQTAKEFLQRKDFNKGGDGSKGVMLGENHYPSNMTTCWRYSFDECEGHAVLAKSCMFYLKLNDFQSNRFETMDSTQRIQAAAGISTWNLAVNIRASELREQHKFLSYAAQSWADHYRHATAGGNDQWKQLGHNKNLFFISRDLCRPGNSMRTWVSVRRWSVFLPTSDSSNELFVRSAIGHADEVRELLASETSETSWNAKSLHYALELAVRERHYPVVRTLLDMREFSLSVDVLKLSAKSGQTETLRAILAAGDFKSDPFLILQILLNAIEKGDVHVVKTLLQYGEANRTLRGGFYDINRIEKMYRRNAYQIPLHTAVRCDRLEIVVLLLEWQAKDCDILTPEDHFDLYVYLMYGPQFAGVIASDTSGEKKSPVAATMSRKVINIEVVDSSGQTALHISACHDQSKNLLTDSIPTTAIPAKVLDTRRNILRLLIEHGADVDARDELWRSPIFYAVECGYQTEFEILKSYGAKLDMRDFEHRTLLHIAASTKALAIMKDLLASGLDVNARDDRRKTPLHVAAEYSSLECVKFLILKGADVLKQDLLGELPLHSALRANREDLVQELLEHDPHLGNRTRDKCAALMLAARGDLGKVLKVFLQLQPELEATDSDGRTALYNAVANGGETAAEMLLIAGADPLTLDSEQNSLLHAAVWQEEEDVLWLVLDFVGNKLHGTENCFGQTPLKLAQEVLARAKEAKISGWSKKTIKRMERYCEIIEGTDSTQGAKT